MTAQQQIDALKQQLLEAYVQREQADQRIKSIRDALAGVALGQQLAAEALPPTPKDPATDGPESA